MNLFLRSQLALVVLVGFTGISGCSLANSVLEAGPGPDSGFRVGDYHSVVVAPVNTGLDRGVDHRALTFSESAAYSGAIDEDHRSCRFRNPIVRPLASAAAAAL
jgi:hypothetical protein